MFLSRHRGYTVNQPTALNLSVNAQRLLGRLVDNQQIMDASRNHLQRWC
jgi:hypothetical protein